MNHSRRWLDLSWRHFPDKMFNRIRIWTDKEPSINYLCVINSRAETVLNSVPKRTASEQYGRGTAGEHTVRVPPPSWTALSAQALGLGSSVSSLPAHDGAQCGRRAHPGCSCRLSDSRPHESIIPCCGLHNDDTDGTRATGAASATGAAGGHHTANIVTRI